MNLCKEVNSQLPAEKAQDKCERNEHHSMLRNKPPSKYHRPYTTKPIAALSCLNWNGRAPQRHLSLKHSLLIHLIFLESTVFSQEPSQVFLWHIRLYPHHLCRGCMRPKIIQSGFFSGMHAFLLNASLWNKYCDRWGDTWVQQWQECKPFLSTTSLKKHLRSINKSEALAHLAPSGKTSNTPAHFNGILCGDQHGEGGSTGTTCWSSVRAVCSSLVATSAHGKVLIARSQATSNSAKLNTHGMHWALQELEFMVLSLHCFSWTLSVTLMSYKSLLKQKLINFSSFFKLLENEGR